MFSYSRESFYEIRRNLSELPYVHMDFPPHITCDNNINKRTRRSRRGGKKHQLKKSRNLLTCGAGDITRTKSPCVSNIVDDIETLSLPKAVSPNSQSATLNNRTKLNVGFWNVRTLRETGSQSLTMRALHDYKIDIACLSEVRLPDSGMRKIKVPGHEADFWLYHSGPPNNSGTKGIAIAVNARAKLALMDWDPLSDRIMRARFAGSPFNLTVIAVYAPTTLAEEDEKDLFYDELQRVFSSIPNNDIVILAGDWNAQLGPGDINTRHIIGRYGLGERCVNGERLLNFADFNRLVVASTMFQHKRRHLVTWYSNDGHTANQIDHLLTNSRWATSVKDCRSYRGAETGNKHGSDHVLVRASIKLRLSRTHSSKGSQRLNIAALHTDGVHDRLVSDISDGLAAGTTQYDNLTPWKVNGNCSRRLYKGVPIII